jgi:hypothetical protein
VIPVFKTPSIACDYLIICPDQFLASAQRLAAHRNGYAGDDVDHAMAVTLATIEKEFSLPDTLPRGFAIWYAMQYARKNWTGKPKYLVLMGDDSVAVNGFDSTSMPENAGLVPTFVNYVDTSRSYIDSTLDTTVYYSDFLYSMMTDTTPPVTKDGRYWNIPNTFDSVSFSIGRIPAQTVAEADNYVSKVIAYEALQGSRGWQNKTILCADDRMQGLRPDPLGSQHLLSSELICDSLLGGFFTSKVYLSSFTKSTMGRHDDARKAFFSRVGSGARWCVYFGHGHEDSLSDEGFLRNMDVGLFANDSAPALFFSFSCSNGDFIRKPVSQMCKSYLFKPSGGCIAYFAASIESYASDNEQLAMALFSQKPGAERLSIGEAVRRAHVMYPLYNSMVYQLLGDPALLFCKKKESFTPAITVGDDGVISVTGITTPQVISGQPFYRYEISCPESIWCIDNIAAPDLNALAYMQDSVIASKEGPLLSSIQAKIPAFVNADKIKFSLYVADNESETRFDTIIAYINGIRVQASARIPHGPVVAYNRGVVTVSVDHTFDDAIPQLSVFDMKGRLVKHAVMPVVRDRASLDLNAMGIAEGNYLLRIKMKRQTFIVKACLLR